MPIDNIVIVGAIALTFISVGIIWTQLNTMKIKR